eukprot:974819-Rhodomonas_salina.3
MHSTKLVLSWYTVAGLSYLSPSGYYRLVQNLPNVTKRVSGGARLETLGVGLFVGALCPVPRAHVQLYCDWPT